MRRGLWLAMLLPLWARADEIPVADFVRGGGVRQVQISPDGSYVAEARTVEGQDFLEVVRLSDRKITNVMKLGDRRQVAQYWWVSKDRLVAAFAEQYGILSQHYLTGELEAMDADSSSGRPGKYLFGHREAGGAFSDNIHLETDTARAATVIRALPQDGHKAIISLNDFSNAVNADYGEVDRVDVYSGAREQLSAGPVRGYTEFMADAAGNPRYAVAADSQFHSISFYKPAPKDDWKALNVAGLEKALIEPVAFSGDGHRVFLRSDEGGDRLCLVEQNLDSGARRKLSCDAAADVSGVIFSFDHQEPIAVLYEGAPPWQRPLDSSHPDAARLKQLLQAFPGQIVDPVSSTEDGSKVILRVYSDRNPGDYYLFEPKTMHADLLASQGAWINPEQMGEQRAVEFKARDGQTLHGLLTLPADRPVKGLPLVVNPHGGPFDILDVWGWAPETQLLASRGYAVLQINFRGSGGYGKAFLAAGKQHWDTVMIDDITDGTQWAIRQGIADSRRICIYGGSYGGYAALMSAVREPQLYRCTIGYAGVYDLNLLKSDGDLRWMTRGEAFFKAFAGSTAEQLKAASPLSYIDRLKAAVMIVHGEADERVPVSQAHALRAALEARTYPYEWLVKPHEAHGFTLEADRQELYEKLLAFLDRNIGAKAATPQSGVTAQADAAAKP